jgi:hypothetical protein
MITSQSIKDNYNGSKFIEGVQDIHRTKMVYKHKSPIDFVDFIEEVDKKGLRNSTRKASQGNDESYNWYGQTNDLSEAIQKYRTAKFGLENAKKSSNLIIKMRQGVKYEDVGDELSVPEYLAGSKNHFIEYQDRRRKKRATYNHPIFINLSCNASVDGSEMERITSTVVNTLYKYKVRVPKIVLSYTANGASYKFGDVYLFIDVQYFDFNSLARFFNPSAYRRIGFTNYECIEDLDSGYGQSPTGGDFPKTLDDVIFVKAFVDKSSEEIERILDEAIQNTFNPKKK